MKVATVNLWAKNQRPAADARMIEGFDWDVVGVNEAHNHLEEILPVWQDSFHIRRPITDNPTRGSRELLVLIRKGQGFEIVNWKAYKVSEPAYPLRLAPERWLLWVKFKDAKGNKFKMIVAHPNASVQDRSDGRLLSRTIKRVFGWVKVMRAIASEVKEARDSGYTPIVTGDLNYRRYPHVRDFVLAYWAPQNVFRRAGMGWREHSVDYVAWGVGRLKYKNDGTINPARHGGDHFWLWVQLEIT